jgi:hypothetical protein
MPHESERPRKRLYTVQEAALYLGRSPLAVCSTLWAGKLPAVRDGNRREGSNNGGHRLG